MSIIAKSGENTQNFTPAPAGNHLAVCVGITHIGTNYSEMYEKDFNQVNITWELSNETYDDSEGNPQLYLLSRTYTLSLHEKATLRKDLDAWRGKRFTDDELKGFDITTILGAPCMVTAIHNDNGKAKVVGVASLPKGMPKPKAVNELKTFDYDNNFDMKAIEAFPEWVRDAIRSSVEYKQRVRELEAQPHEDHLKAIAEEDDYQQLPF